MANKQNKQNKSAFNQKGLFAISWLRFDEEPSGLYYKERDNGEQMFATSLGDAMYFTTERAAWEKAESLMDTGQVPLPYFDIEQVI
jgi:sugar/nucleoside kinase (ribokinase family)